MEPVVLCVLWQPATGQRLGTRLADMGAGGRPLLGREEDIIPSSRPNHGYWVPDIRPGPYYREAEAELVYGGLHVQKFWGQSVYDLYYSRNGGKVSGTLARLLLAK